MSTREDSRRIGCAWPRLALVAVAAACAVGAGANAAGANPPRAIASLRVPCRSARGTSTIARSRRARVFADERTGYYYACLYASGHPRRLSTIEHWEYQLVRFAGPYVAFVALAEGVDAEVGVVNLRSGRRQAFREGEEVAPVEPPSSECPSADAHCKLVCPEVDSLALAPNGAVAWIGVDFPAASPEGGAPCGTGIEQTTEVRRHDAGGLAVIGSGNGIAPHSLRLSGTTLSWRDEGRPVTATLP